MTPFTSKTSVVMRSRSVCTSVNTHTHATTHARGKENVSSHPQFVNSSCVSHPLLSLFVLSADVSHFVKPGTALDAEARHRATTIYLVNKAIPMLPPILCEQLCSLNPNVDRLAYSTIFTMNKSTGKVSDTKKPWFGRTVIRTAARLNYETAQWLMEFDRAKLNGRPATEEDFEGQLKINMTRGHPYRPVDCVSIDELLNDMQLLHRVSMRRRKDRFEIGSLTLSNVKLQFQLDADRNPCGFYTYPLYDSNRVVEECMLLANMLVAHQCVAFCRDVALLRRHPPPNEKSMTKVAQACQELGFDIDAHTAGTLQRSMDAYEQIFVGRTHGVDDQTIVDGTIPIRQVLEPLCTKPMQLAKVTKRECAHGARFKHVKYKSPLTRSFRCLSLCSISARTIPILRIGVTTPCTSLSTLISLLLFVVTLM